MLTSNDVNINPFQIQILECTLKEHDMRPYHSLRYGVEIDDSILTKIEICRGKLLETSNHNCPALELNLPKLAFLKSRTKKKVLLDRTKECTQMMLKVTSYLTREVLGAPRDTRKGEEYFHYLFADLYCFNLFLEQGPAVVEKTYCSQGEVLSNKLKIGFSDYLSISDQALLRDHFKVFLKEVERLDKRFKS